MPATLNEDVGVCRVVVVVMVMMMMTSQSRAERGKRGLGRVRGANLGERLS